MPIGMVGLLSATLFCLGLASLFERSSLSRKALGLGLMLQAGLLLVAGVGNRLEQLDGQVLSLIGIGLLPLVCMPWRAVASRERRSIASQPDGIDEGEN